MKDNLEIFIGGDTTTSQLAAQVAACRVENPNSTIVVLTEFPDWRQARAAFAAGASDYLPKSQNATL